MLPSSLRRCCHCAMLSIKLKYKKRSQPGGPAGDDVLTEKTGGIRRQIPFKGMCNVALNGLGIHQGLSYLSNGGVRYALLSRTLIHRVLGGLSTGLVLHPGQDVVLEGYRTCMVAHMLGQPFAALTL